MTVFTREIEMGTWTVKIILLTVVVKEERDQNKVFETLEMEPSTLLKTELGTS